MLLSRFLCQQLKSAVCHPSRESWMERDEWKPVVDSCPFPMLHMQWFAEPSLQHLSSYSLHFTFSSYKRTRRCTGLWQSRLQLITLHINADTHSKLPVSQVPRYFEAEQQHTPLCWQFTTTTRSLIKTAEIPAPKPANRWELARVQVLWDTVEGQGWVCAGNCTADTALLRISPSVTFNSLSLCPNSVL